MKVKRLVVLALLALCSAWGTSAHAQSDRGTITGTVTDQSGAVVAAAKVTATATDTGEVRETTTSGEGSYTFAEVKAAPYKISVEAPGFKTATTEDVKVAVQVTRTVDFTLEVGAVGDTVTVTAEDTPVIQTDSPVRQTNVNERQVKELPLAVAAESGGRNAVAFISSTAT